MKKFEDYGTTLVDYFGNRLDYNAIMENPSLSYDMTSLLLGKKLGEGVYRAVYDYSVHPDYVIKLEGGNTFCNINEAQMWVEIQGLTGKLAWVKDWFAPVNTISPNGRVLIMRKTYDIPNKKKPAMIPSFLWDVKTDNFGWLNGKYVCHDYGQFYNFITYKKSFKKANW